MALQSNKQNLFYEAFPKINLTANFGEHSHNARLNGTDLFPVFTLYHLYVQALARCTDTRDVHAIPNNQADYLKFLINTEN